MKTRQLTAIIEREGAGYVALCLELDVASQGDTVEEARSNLLEALELFFETADPKEIDGGLHDEVYVTRIEVPVGDQLPRRSAADIFRDVGRWEGETGKSLDDLFVDVRQRSNRCVPGLP